MKNQFYLLLPFVLFFMACTESKKIEATAISLDKNSIELSIGETELIKVKLEPTNTTEKVVWSSSDNQIATVENGLVTAKAAGSATISAAAGSHNAQCKVTVRIPAPDGAVDLGLSVFWSKCNIGAAKPEEFGGYYAWGEIDVKQEYSWSSYKWANGYYFMLSKYCPSDKSGFCLYSDTAPDDKINLDSEDDIAHVLLGGNWRMPTAEELTELNTQCTWIWDRENGVKGARVTGPNGNSIFLPAAGGYWSGTDIHNEGSAGYYWSNSLETQEPSSANLLWFYIDGHIEDGPITIKQGKAERQNGMSIRPVIK